MNKTSIKWTDFTVNPFRFRNLETGKVGHHCDKISPGCKNCYSSTMQAGPYLSGLTFIETNKPKGEFFLDENALEQVLRRKKPCRIFWCDMTDMFLEDYPDEWIDRCFAVMALTPHLTHQVLTKRAGRMRAWFERGGPRKSDIAQFDLAGCVVNAFARSHLIKAGLIPKDEFTEEENVWIDRLPWLHASGPMMMWPLPNVHLGVSVENQEYADKRIPDLLATPAAVRFVSYEPALGPVDFTKWLPITTDGRFHFADCACLDCHRNRMTTGATDGCTRWLDQIIIGGESGSSARPFDIAWARNTIAQCKAAGVAVFMKQVGAKPWDSASSEIDHLFEPCGHACDCCDDCSADQGRGGHERDDHPQLMKLRDKKGGSMSEWPADLRVRQTPEAIA